MSDNIENKNETPVAAELVKEVPAPKKLSKSNNKAAALDKNPPSVLNEENCVTINGVKTEIKPTKVVYMRSKCTGAYKLLRAVPLDEFLSVGKGVWDEHKDGDQLLFDFLVAVFDDPEFVNKNYDNMTAEDIDRIVSIYGRINKIEEKEEAARKKKREAAQANR